MIINAIHDKLLNLSARVKILISCALFLFFSISWATCLLVLLDLIPYWDESGQSIFLFIISLVLFILNISFFLIYAINKNDKINNKDILK